MKKIYFILILLALILMSCTEAEINSATEEITTSSSSSEQTVNIEESSSSESIVGSSSSVQAYSSSEEVSSSSHTTVSSSSYIEENAAISSSSIVSTPAYPISIKNVENSYFIIEFEVRNNTANSVNNIELEYQYQVNDKTYVGTCIQSSIAGSSFAKCRINKPSVIYGNISSFLYIYQATLDGKELYMEQYDYSIYNKQIN